MTTTHTVYTAIISGYEDLKEPTVVTPGWRYLAFTDQIITSAVWEIKQIEVNLPPQRMARYIKLNFHKFVHSEFSLWLDASFRIDCDLNKFWAAHFKSPFTAPAHPIRNCVYREVASCIANKRGDEGELVKQGEAYKSQQVPAFGGIITSGVLMRQNTIGCQRMCEEWWDELSRHSVRDQIAFANISRGWRHFTFRWDYTNNRELTYIRHYHLRH